MARYRAPELNLLATYSTAIDMWYVVIMVLQRWCCNGVTMVLQWCYNGVTIVLQWCYKGVTVVLQLCYNGVTMVL
jgi:hypothetical protein